MIQAIVCGGRNYKDRDHVFSVLDQIHDAHHIDLLVTGGARGADSIAIEWAIARNVPSQTILPNWDLHGRAAGPIRNAEMLDLGVTHVIAFPGGKGTADMVRQAKRRAGVTILEASHIVPTLPPDPSTR